MEITCAQAGMSNIVVTFWSGVEYGGKSALVNDGGVT